MKINKAQQIESDIINLIKAKAKQASSLTELEEIRNKAIDLHNKNYSTILSKEISDSLLDKINRTIDQEIARFKYTKALKQEE